MYGVIYLIWNFLLNIGYVGQRKCKSEKEFYNSNYWGRSENVKRDIRLYGEENFERIILCKTYSANDANKKEHEFALKYRTYYWLSGGYNMHECGTGRWDKYNSLGLPSPTKGKKRSEESRNKQSLKTKGRPQPWNKGKPHPWNKGISGWHHTGEWIELHSGKNHHGYGKIGPNKGRDFSKEWKNNLSIACKGSKNGNSILTENQVVEIIELKSRKETNKNISIRYGISERTVRAIYSGQIWNHITKIRSR